MSIGPVQNLGPLSKAQVSDPQSSCAHPGAPSRKSEPTVASETGNAPIREKGHPNDSPTPPQPAEDEVQLQHDTELKNDFIITYLNKAGQVVLQVPSEQMLSVERGIAREVEQACPDRSITSAERSSNKGEPHGH